MNKSFTKCFVFTLSLIYIPSALAVDAESRIEDTYSFITDSIIPIFFGLLFSTREVFFNSRTFTSLTEDFFLLLGLFICPIFGIFFLPADVAKLELYILTTLVGFILLIFILLNIVNVTARYEEGQSGNDILVLLNIFRVTAREEKRHIFVLRTFYILVTLLGITSILLMTFLIIRLKYSLYTLILPIISALLMILIYIMNNIITEGSILWMGRLAYFIFTIIVFSTPYLLAINCESFFFFKVLLVLPLLLVTRALLYADKKLERLKCHGIISNIVYAFYTSKLDIILKAELMRTLGRTGLFNVQDPAQQYSFMDFHDKHPKISIVEALHYLTNLDTDTLQQYVNRLDPFLITRWEKICENYE
jgi:hypothetical protein